MSDEKRKLSPMFLIKPGSMSPRDIRRAEKACGIVIAECSDPDATRHLDKPIDADIDLQAWAALSLVRSIVNSDAGYTTSYSKGTLLDWFVQRLMSGKPIESVKRVASSRK